MRESPQELGASVSAGSDCVKWLCATTRDHSMECEFSRAVLISSRSVVDSEMHVRLEHVTCSVQTQPHPP